MARGELAKFSKQVRLLPAPPQHTLTTTADASFKLHPRVLTVAMKTRHLVFVGIVITVCAAFIGPLTQLVKFSLGNPIGTYIVLVPPLCIALLWEDHHKIFTKGSFDWRLGLAFFAASLFVSSIAGSSNSIGESRLSILSFSLVLAWLGAFAMCYGSPTMARARFALLFLLLTIPPPPFLTKALVQGLQYESTIFTDWFFHLSGVPFHREGFLFMLPGNSLEIAEECSGIGSTMFLLLISIVVSYFYLHRWWLRLLLMLLIFPISIVKNALRVFTLGIVGTYIDPTILESKLHQYSGALFFVFSLALLYVSLCLFAWLEKIVCRGEIESLSGQSFATTWDHT